MVHICMDKLEDAPHSLSSYVSVQPLSVPEKLLTSATFSNWTCRFRGTESELVVLIWNKAAGSLVISWIHSAPVCSVVALDICPNSTPSLLTSAYFSTSFRVSLLLDLLKHVSDSEAPTLFRHSNADPKH